MDSSNDKLKGLINLADASLGAKAQAANDEFFASKERMLNPDEPVSRPGVYDDHGQWMDGWETRRRREPGNDWCIVTLAYRGEIRYIDIDTRYFTGNYAPEASVDACESDDALNADTKWTELLSRRVLNGNDHNLFQTNNHDKWRALRINIFPDGGIARLRAWGKVTRDFSKIDNSKVIDLLAIEYGGSGLICTDQHYGNINKLNRPGRGENMGDGWETRRRRSPGFDWAVLRLGHPGIVESVVIDTAHFKGNYPESVSVHAALVDESENDDLASTSMDWGCLLPAQKMSADTEHRFEKEINGLGAVSHVRVNLHPDGGITRIRVFGKLARKP